MLFRSNQSDFQDALRPFVRGSHMALVSKSQFQDISIRVPPLEIQDQVLAFQALVDREKQLSAAIQQKRQELFRAVSHKLMTGQLTVPGHTP